MLELMVTVTIVGILAGLSIVSFARNWRDERVKAAARESTAWLDEVRKVAIQKAKPCRIQINQGSLTLSLDPNPANDQEFCAANLYAPLSIRNTVQNSGELVLCSIDLQTTEDPATKSLSCTSAQSGTSSLIFTPRGTTTSGLLIKIHMPQSGADRCIAVLAPLGQIRSGKATPSGCDFTTAF